MRTTPRPLAAALLVAVALTACASDDAADEAAVEEMAADAPAGDDAESSADESADRAVDAAGASVASLAPAGRQLARTARLVVEVDDVVAGAAAVRATATRLGGFVAEEDVRSGPDGYGVLTLRVPAGSLDAAVADLADVGSALVSSSLSTEDLTDTLTDLDARLRNLRTLEAELLALLGEVRDGDPGAGELLTVFDRVNQVRSDVERLEASRAAAQDRVALATVTVELRAVEVVVAGDDGGSAWADAWADTREAFGVLGGAAVVLLVTVLPVALAVALPVALLWAAWRRARRRDRAPDAAPAPTGAPGATLPEPAGTDA